MHDACLVHCADGDSARAQARSVMLGRESRAVGSKEELDALLRAGITRRRQAETLLNERSSRAHTVLLLSLGSEGAAGAHGSGGAADRDGGAAPAGPRTLCLADLGGSEQVSKSILAPHGTLSAAAQDARLGEAVQINLGLLALRRCITALALGDPHVPFADAKLTQMLRPSLKGSSVTAVLVTLRSEAEHARHSTEVSGHAPKSLK